jgi:hypothetical protein
MMKMKRDVGPLPSEHLQSFSLLASSGNLIGFGDSLKLTFRKNSWCHFFTGTILVTRESVENTKKKGKLFLAYNTDIVLLYGFLCPKAPILHHGHWLILKYAQKFES